MVGYSRVRSKHLNQPVCEGLAEMYEERGVTFLVMTMFKIKIKTESDEVLEMMMMVNTSGKVVTSAQS